MLTIADWSVFIAVATSLALTSWAVVGLFLQDHGAPRSLAVIMPLVVTISAAAVAWAANQKSNETYAKSQETYEILRRLGKEVVNVPENPIPVSGAQSASKGGALTSPAGDSVDRADFLASKLKNRHPNPSQGEGEELLLWNSTLIMLAILVLLNTAIHLREDRKLSKVLSRNESDRKRVIAREDGSLVQSKANLGDESLQQARTSNAGGVLEDAPGQGASGILPNPEESVATAERKSKIEATGKVAVDTAKRLSNTLQELHDRRDRSLASFEQAFQEQSALHRFRDKLDTDERRQFLVSAILSSMLARPRRAEDGTQRNTWSSMVGKDGASALFVAEIQEALLATAERDPGAFVVLARALPKAPKELAATMQAGFQEFASRRRGAYQFS